MSHERERSRKTAEDPSAALEFYEDVEKYKHVIERAGKDAYWTTRGGREGFAYQGRIYIFGSPSGPLTDACTRCGKMRVVHRGGDCPDLGGHGAKWSSRTPPEYPARGFYLGESWFSYDNGATWPRERRAGLHPEGGQFFPCLVVTKIDRATGEVTLRASIT